MKAIKEKALYHTATALLIWSLCSATSATINAWLDRNQVDAGESVQLTLQRDGNSDKQPDLTPLKRDFDILGSSRGSSVQIINGTMSSQHQIRLTLAPKHAGRIQIPPLQWEGERSSPVELEVGGSHGSSNTHPNNNPNNGITAAPTSHVFLSSTVDQKQPYVQAAVTLTVRLYTDKPLYQASLDLPANNEVIVQPLGKDQQTSEIREGRRYQVIERKYLVFPQRSGQISLEGPVLDAAIPDTSRSDPFDDDAFFGNVFSHTPLAGMMRAMRPMRLHGDAIKLDVRPRPATMSHDWLPAQNVTIEESWRPNTLSAHVGEPLTRHLRLSALGLTAAQLPDLSTRLTLPEGIKAYPDQPKLDNSVQTGSIMGKREQDIALIANRPGRYLIPAIHVFWWDTIRNVQREVVLPARTLNILPGAAKHKQYNDDQR